MIPEKRNSDKKNYKVPEGYFDQLNEDILSKIEKLDSDQNQIIPAKSKPLFKTPENYFDQIENEVLEKIKKDQPKSKVFSLSKNQAFYVISSIAAIFVVLLSLFLKEDPNENISLADISTEEIQDYLFNQNPFFVESEIAAVENMESLAPTDLFEETNLEEDNLEEYLIEELDETNFYLE